MMPEIAVVMNAVRKKSDHQPIFLQAVQEVFEWIEPAVRRHPKYTDYNILERLVEPERMIIFRVPWVDDQGKVRVNRGFRIEMNSAIGPYKGGSDFDPKGKSDLEVMRFCQAFMNELYRHIGPNTDVPAGDIGVGGREIGYLYGQYKKLKNEFSGAITGKGYNWGGSLIRPEATGYGAVYFAQEMLQGAGQGLKGKICAVSGSGNVAQFTVQKLLQLGAKVVTLSDSDGFVHDPQGIDEEKLAWVMQLKNVRRGRISEYLKQYPKAKYVAGKRPWGVKCDCAFPSACENEINGDDAAALLKNGCRLVCEGANMPCTPEAVHQFIEKKIHYGPGKAANAGGVAVSGLEMAQNGMHLYWTREEVDKRLELIMCSIHRTASDYAQEYGRPGNLVMGANIGGFVRVADSMIDQGVC